jgi:hypothetical protein
VNQPRRSIDVLVAGVFFLALAAVFWWPISAHPATVTFQSAFGDPALNAWILAWDADRMRHGFAGYWEGLFFYPYPDVIAYSEHLLGIALFTAPVQWVSDNPVLALNLASIASTVLAGVGMFVLARELTGRADAALVAATAFAYAPYRGEIGGHLQVMVSGWMPLACFGLHRFLATRSLRALAGFVAAFLLQAYSNGYFLYFMAVPVAIVVAQALWRARPRWGAVALPLAAAGAVTLAALSPVAAAYLRVRQEQGLARDTGDMMQFSADLADYVSVGGHLWAWAHVLPIGRHEHALFPGLVISLLGVIGAVAGLRPAQSERDAPRLSSAVAGHARAYFFSAAVLALLSLGPYPAAFGWRLPYPGPYLWLAVIVPGLDGLRAPARTATALYMALSVLGAIGFCAITARTPGRHRRVLCTMVTAAIALEGYRLPWPAAEFPTKAMKADTPAYLWLRDQPRGPALELPVGDANLASRHQYRTLEHGHRIVNGYSGYGSALQDFVGGPPFNEPAHVPDALAMARAIGLRWILVHPDLYASRGDGSAILQAMREDTADVARVADLGTVSIAELRPMASLASLPVDPSWRQVGPDSFDASASHNAGSLSRAFDGVRASRWLTGQRQQGDEWIELHFREPMDVRRVRLEMDRRSFGDYPRRLVIEGASEERQWRTLYEGRVVDRLGVSIAREPRSPGIDIVLPPNDTRVLRLRNTGITRRMYWSVHEVRLWRR